MYSEIYEACLAKLSDYDLAGLEQDERYLVLSEYIRPACVRFGVCKQDLSDRDDTAEKFNADLSDAEIEIIASLLAQEYIDATSIRTQELMKLSLTGRDFHFVSQKDQLNALMAMRGQFAREVARLMSEYSYSGSELFE